MDQEFDWLAATLEDRKRLYRAMSTAWRRRNWSCGAFLAAATGQPHSAGKDYEANLRAGKIARSKCGPIHRWLRSNEPDLCARLERELAQSRAPSKANWNDLLIAEGRYAHLELLRLARDPLAIVTAARKEPVADCVLRLGEWFCFELTSPIAGFAIALQSMGTAWYPLVLAPGSNVTAVDAAPLLLPRGEMPDDPQPLHETSDDGLHRFVFVVVDDASLIGEIVDCPEAVPIEAELLDRLAEQLRRVPFDRRMILRINVLFKA